MRRTALHSIAMLCLFWPPQSRATTLHPVSYTDAWVKVSDRVDVRLNIFLDDVLRYEGLLDESVNTVPRETIVRAIDAYSDRISDQLRIYGARGTRLLPSVTSSPEWRQAKDVVDVSANELLKLTWKLQYSAPANESLELLTFEHEFTHPLLPNPGELRLHTQHVPTSRRIDAVVRPGRPHVIHLPHDRENVSDLDLNIMQTRMVLSAGAISVEFMAPAVLMNEYAGLTSDREAEPGLVHRRQAFERWAQKEVNASINGRQAECSGTSVEFPEMSPQRRSEGGLETALADNEEPNWRTRMVGIRMIFPRPRRVQSFHLSVACWPTSFDDVGLDLVTSKQRSSQLVSGSSVREPAFAYEWNPGPVRTALPLPKARTNEALVVVKVDTSARFLAWCLAGLGFVALGVGVLGSSRSRPVSASICLVCVFAAFFSATRKHYEADNEKLERFLQSSLAQIYSSLQWNDDQAVVESLGEFLDEEMLEETYLAVLESVAGDADQPLATIQSLVVSDVAAASNVSAAQLTVDCRWNVVATVEHWGHAHQRTLSFFGSLQLKATDSKWRIVEFHPGEVQFAENLQAKASFPDFATFEAARFRDASVD